MKILLSQVVKTLEDKPIGIIKKEVESIMIPSIGMLIEDQIWEEPIKVTEVIINYLSDQCFVGLDNYKIHETNKQDFAEEAKLCKWVIYFN